MADTLFFLGAGASAPFGIPTMQGMVDSFEEELRAQTSNAQAQAKSETELYTSIKDSLKKGYENVDLEPDKKRKIALIHPDAEKIADAKFSKHKDSISRITTKFGDASLPRQVIEAVK